MGSRHRARELAFQFLYSLDLSKSTLNEGLPQFEKDWLAHEPEDIHEFSKLLINGTSEHLKEIDDLLEKYSINWKLSRMGAVDRNILRLAVFELKWVKDVPPKVTINEAIELAKKYGSEDSGSFVNGMLDKIASETEA